MTANGKPLVSVVMPVYNGERYLAEAIESILAQSHSNLELIIVDDCSADGSPAIIRGYAKADDRIRLILLERNQGSATARNSGIAVARGEFIAAMDCDDISLPQRLEKQVDFLLSHPGIGVVGVSVESGFDDMTERKQFVYPREHAFIVWNWILRRRSVSGPAYMARRNVLLSVGGYEDSRRITDDAELFSRLFAKTRFANLPETLYLYRRHANQKSVKLQKAQQQQSIAIRQRLVDRLWGEAPPASIERLNRLRRGAKFSWRERRRLRRDVERLIKALYKAEKIAADDLPLLEAEIYKSVESTMPRPWLIFIHWWRHRIGPLI